MTELEDPPSVQMQEPKGDEVGQGPKGWEIAGLGWVGPDFRVGRYDRAPGGFGIWGSGRANFKTTDMLNSQRRGAIKRTRADKLVSVLFSTR